MSLTFLASGFNGNQGICSNENMSESSVILMLALKVKEQEEPRATRRNNFHGSAFNLLSRNWKGENEASLH
ncbi:MAG: hypothetical protein M1113_02265 [Candidatus Thermoplasmatota archaeon]|nr:hypothetical protein [Candidatus Thermoplasmatota archaeon]